VTAWWNPDGSNYDLYLWDAFTPASAGDIGTIEWRGSYGASGSPINFTVAIYASIPAGSQPDVSHPPLVEYEIGDNAGETYAGLWGGVVMYDYSFTMPTTFPAQAGVKYWLQIEAWQSGFPDWAVAAGLGGDGTHFLCEHNNIVVGDAASTGDVVMDAGVPTGCWFTSRTGDVAFSLLSTDATDVGDPAGLAEFALGGVLPNPSRGDRLEVTFTLPDAAPATLALFDVGGRRVALADVGALGAGKHVVDLARRAPIRSGIYFVRLSRGGQEAASRAAIVR
ncbi:MAG: T9SS type A sorting domain-containing protein, partial [Anaerolineaceae bacterium]